MKTSGRYAVLCSTLNYCARALHCIAVTAALVVGARCVFPPSAVAAQAATAAPKSAQSAQNGGPSAPAPADFSVMVERYGPAVVNISPPNGAEQQAGTPGLDELEPDDSLLAFFRSAASQRQPLSAPSSSPRVIWGTGAGFIVSADGLIVTTAHVVNRADQVTVTLTDRRRMKAKVLGVDPISDVALLQIEGAAKLPTVRLGDSSRVRAGQQVLTVGLPEGQSNTVTSGLISATPHGLPDGTHFPFFQTDLAVTPDHSGAPVLDRNGEVIGVNVQVYPGVDRYQALTFAIPASAVIKLRARLQGQGKVAGGSLGLEVQDLDPGLAAAFGLSRPIGAIVTSVTSTGRDAVGIKAGDVITHVNGKLIEHSADFADVVSGLRPGSKATLKAVRNKKPITMTMTVVAQAADAAAVPGENDLDRLGLTVRALSDPERRASEVGSGVVIETVSGDAAGAGFEPGDIVVSVNGSPVMSREELNALIGRGAKDAAFLIQRDNVRRFLSFKVR